MTRTRTSMEELQDIARLDPLSQEFREAKNQFFVDRSLFFHQQAVRTCRKYRLDVDRHVSDVSSVVFEAALKLVNDVLANRDGRLTAVRVFEAYLTRYIQAEMKPYTGSEAMMPAAGMHSVSRRRIRYENFRERLFHETGREPTVDEVVEAANTDAFRTRKDPKRQGILLTSADARAVDSFDLEAVDTLVGATDNVLHPLEGKEMVAEIVARCEREDPLLGRVARAWVGEFYGDGGHQCREVSEVMEATGLSRVRVVRAIHDIRGLAMRVVEEYLAGPQ